MERIRRVIHQLSAGRHRPYRGYFVGLATMALLILVRRLFFDDFFTSELPLRLFMLPVIAAAWSGGLRPGLFITALSAVVAPLVFGDLSTGHVDWRMTLTFSIVGIVVSGFMESLHTARRRLEERQQLLEHEANERRKAETAERTQRQRLAQEIEQRVLAETALREQEERIRMAVESANIGTWDVNALTGQRRWSERTKAIFGLAADADVSGLKFIDLLHPEDRQHVQLAIERALDTAGEGNYEVEYRARLLDGTIRWIVARGRVFFEGQGHSRRAVRFIGTVFDFSRRKELEQALQDADRRKDEFLATLAHELRNPLAPIGYALQLWPLVENDPAESENLRSMMGRQMAQITRLIDDLMDVSRITRGKIELRKQPLDICTVIQGAIEAVRPFVESQGHRLTVTLPSAPVIVDGDEARLSQVFGNILNNATKFSNPNGEIWLSARQEADQVVVSIRDNGPGIPRHMLKHIFDMFHQLDVTISRSNGGLGIGLTLVKQLVELHGGTVEALSDGPDTGSEFVVRIPLSIPAAGDAAGSGSFHLRRLRQLPAHRILVVDDLESSAKTLAMMLRAMGQDVLALHDGRAAIDWIRVHKPDAVFLDIAMPAMNGYEAAKRLREDKELADVILIALTGYGQDEDRRQAMAAGFNHHLVKPPSIETLERILLSIPASQAQPLAASSDARD